MVDDQNLQIGLMSDSHDCLPKIKDAVTRMNAECVELVLHAGDFSAPFVTSCFTKLKERMVGVYGNNDAEKALLRDRLAEGGHEMRGRFAELRIESLKIALIHGDERELLQSLITSGVYDVVVHGHTHEASLSTDGRTFVVNPGEICGYLSGKSTYAILDSTTRNARVVSF